MAVKTHGVAVVRGAENHVFLRPRMWANNPESKPAVIAAPGRGAGAGQPMAVPYFGHVTEALAAAGYPVLSVQGGTGLFEWGSADAVASVAAGKAYLTTLGVPVDAGVFLLGISMGNAALINWGRANPTLVKGHVGCIPAVDLAQHYATDTPSSATSQIGTAHGGAPQAANNPAANPNDVTWPTRFYTASDDPSCPPAWTASFAAAIGSNAEVRDLGAVGHTPITTPAADVVAFFDSLA